MKCAIYTRVSTDEQGTSIVNQQEYFKDYIQRNNFDILDIYSDEAFSGTESTKRLSFQRLLEDGKKKRYEVLLAKSYSRFGRNQRETLTALAELFEHGIRIIFVEDGLDSLKDKGQFGLFAWLAEQESRKISERIKMTWEVYNKEGKIHTPSPSYGYDYDKNSKNFVVNQQETEIVNLIFNMYLQGNGLVKIARTLNDMGIPTKRKKTWSVKQIDTIIKSPFYLGHLTQGKNRSIDISIKKVEFLDQKNWIVHKNNHPAIISEEVFYLVQEEHKKRSDYLRQHTRSRHSTKYLFSNLVKCKICGSGCIGQQKGKTYAETHYSCRSYEVWGLARCGHSRNAINETPLKKSIKTDLQDLAENDYRAVRDYYRQNKGNTQQEQSKLDIDTLDKQIEEQTQLANSLLGVFTEGLIGKEQFRLQNDSISSQINVLTAKREEVLFECNKLTVDIDDETETIKAISKLLEIEISEWNNEMMKKVINRINLDKCNNEIEIVYNHQVIR